MTGLWKCSRCGRAFARKNQAHSCQVRTVGDHVREMAPELRDVYRALVARLREFGPVRMDAVRASINLISKHHFGSISVRKDHLRLGFISGAPIQGPRILKSERLGARTFHHSLRLSSPADVDDQLLDWLRTAYDRQSR